MISRSIAGRSREAGPEENPAAKEFDSSLKSRDGKVGGICFLPVSAIYYPNLKNGVVMGIAPAKQEVKK